MDRFGLFVIESFIYSIISAASKEYTREVSDKMGELMNHSDMSQGIFVLINIDQRFFRQKKEEEEYSGFEKEKEEADRLKIVVQVRRFEITR